MFSYISIQTAQSPGWFSSYLPVKKSEPSPARLLITTRGRVTGLENVLKQLKKIVKHDTPFYLETQYSYGKNAAKILVSYSLEKVERFGCRRNTQLTSIKSKGAPRILEVNGEHRITLLPQGSCVLRVPASVQKCWVQDGLEEGSQSTATQQEFVGGGAMAIKQSTEIHRKD